MFGRNEPTEIWNKYEKIKDQHTQTRLNSKSETCHDFYNGRQWKGIAHVKEDELPFKNIVKPIVKYKVATVAQQDMSIIYSPMNTDNVSTYQSFCDALNKYAEQQWELTKMSTKAWKIINNGAKVGDSYIYFYDDKLNSQIIKNINIFLADEQEPDIQKQKFIIIYERRNISDVRADAETNGINKKDIDKIVADEDTENLTDTAKNEVKSDTDGKCSCLLMLSKNKQGIVTITRSTKTVIYQKETAIYSQNQLGDRSVALKIYPIASFIWSEKEDSARGIGEVEQLISNQVSINKNLANRELAIKQFAYPKPVYNSRKIANPQDLDVIGASIEIDSDTVQNVRDIVTYLSPERISADSKAYCDEMTQDTRDLAGAGDNTMGNVDPTKASGTAIIAVQNQAAVPLNEQKARYKQFVEDIALIWYHLWIVYNPQGLEIKTEEQDDLGNVITELIPNDILQQMEINIKIDVSPNSPYDIFAEQQTLDNFLAQKYITFDEYVEALDDNSPVPKNKLKTILDKRQAMAEQQAQLQTQSQMPMPMIQGGMPNAMQQM